MRTQILFRSNHKIWRRTNMFQRCRGFFGDYLWSMKVACCWSSLLYHRYCFWYHHYHFDIITTVLFCKTHYKTLGISTSHLNGISLYSGANYVIMKYALMGYLMFCPCSCFTLFQTLHWINIIVQGSSRSTLGANNQHPNSISSS